MKKYNISSKKCADKHYEFNNIDEAIEFVKENAFDFVDFNLFGSKEVYIDELIDNDYYFAAIVDPITDKVFFQSIWLKLRKERNDNNGIYKNTI